MQQVVSRFMQALRAVTVGAALFIAGNIGAIPVQTAGMHHSHTPVASNAQCQSVCSIGILPEHKTAPFNVHESDDEQPLPFYASLVALVLLLAPFVVKRLHTLASWRPPDLVLLYGRYTVSQ